MWAHCSTALTFRTKPGGGNTKLRTFGPANASITGDNEVKAMTYIPNHVGMVSTEDSRRILRAIFPNYPELKPRYPVPALEPIAPSPEEATL